MATLTVRPAARHRVPTAALVVGALMIGMVAGAAIGAFVVRDTASPATTTVSQVQADNALVDRFLEVQRTGSEADLEALLLPTFRMSSSNPALAARNPAGMWAMTLDGRRLSLADQRTTDVTRVGDVLFWGGSIKDPDPSATPQEYTWTVRVTGDGRFANAWLLFH